MQQSGFDDETEVIDLQASAIACAVADEWAALIAKMTVKPFMPRTLRDALDRLEAITRPSAMRKVRP